MSEYPWNEKNNTFTWLSSLYNPFKCCNYSVLFSMRADDDEQYFGYRRPDTFCDKANDTKSQNISDTRDFWLAKKISTAIFKFSLSYQLSYVFFTCYHYMVYPHFIYILYGECSEGIRGKCSSTKYQLRNWGGALCTNPPPSRENLSF